MHVCGKRIAYDILLSSCSGIQYSFLQWFGITYVAHGYSLGVFWVLKCMVVGGPDCQHIVEEHHAVGCCLVHHLCIKYLHKVRFFLSVQRAHYLQCVTTNQFIYIWGMVTIFLTLSPYFWPFNLYSSDHLGSIFIDCRFLRRPFNTAYAVMLTIYIISYLWTSYFLYSAEVWKRNCSQFHAKDSGLL